MRKVRPHIDAFLVGDGGLLQGDFGPSFQYKDFNVSELIWHGFHVSWKLGLSAMVIAFVLGVSVGSLAALRQNSVIDYATMGVAMTGIAIPNFVMAPVLTLILGLYLRWLPVGGWGDGDLAHAVLPVAALALPQVAVIARLTRGSMIEVLRSNFVRTARAKGLPERITISRHAVKQTSAFVAQLASQDPRGGRGTMWWVSPRSSHDARSRSASAA